MNCEIIQTGSSGNCIIVNNNFMLDCGIPYSKIKDKIKSIKFIFISHRHSDHFNKTTIKKIAYEFPNIKFIVGYDLVKPLIECNVTKKNIFFLEIGKYYAIGEYFVELMYLYHDVPNNCIKIHYPKNDFKMIYATDTSEIDHIEAKNYDLALIEANYDDEETIQKKIVEAKKENKYTYLERVQYTHLSQLKALNWLNKNNIKDYVFIHEHIDRKEEKND